MSAGKGQSGGSEQRRYARLPINLGALIAIAGDAPLQCTIRDYCAGGMFIGADAGAVQGAQPQAEAVLYFALIVNGEQQDYQLNLTVARRVGNGIGVAFRDPDPAALQMLSQLAASPPPLPATPEALGETQAGFAPEYAQIVRPLSEIVLRNVNALCARFIERTDEVLFLAARDAGNNLDEGRYIDGQRELRSRSDKVREAVPPTFERAIEILNNPLSQAQAQPESLGLSDLSLIDKDDFEEFLEVSEMVSELEPEFSEQLFQLGRRFTYLANREIDTSAIPIGPAAICTAISDELKGLRPHRLVVSRIYKTLHQVMSGNLGSFFDEVNEFFIANGVLPVIEKDQPVIKKKPAPPAGFEEPVEPPGDAAAEEDLGELMPGPEGYQGRPQAAPAPSAVMAAPPAMPPAATVSAAPPGMAVPQTVAPGGEIAAGTSLPAGWAGPPAVYAPPSFQQAYSTARTQMALRRQLLPDAGIDFSASMRERGAYSPAQVVDGLNNLQAAYADTARPQQLDVDGIKQRIVDALINDGAPQKMIGESESDGIEVVANLFGALLQDALVAGNAKDHLSRLQPVVHKAALLDPAFFESSDHPLRQVINRVARVREVRDESGQQREQKVNDLIVDANRKFHDDVSVFEPMLAQLDEILQQQQGDYDSKVAEVVASCDEQQKVREERRGEATDVNQNLERSDFPEEWSRWLERSKELEVGQRALMNANTANPHLVSLVWKEADHNLFVFADDVGNKASTLTLQQVAMYLRRGIIKPLDRENDGPAMDRAMFGMVDRFHNQVEEHATQDALTGFLNRKAFVAAIEAALSVGDATSSSKSAALCHLAIENLKAVNDEHGVACGDALIKAVADKLRDEIKGKDLVFGRLAGADLAVFWPRGGIQRAYKKLRSSFEALSDVAVTPAAGDVDPAVTASEAVTADIDVQGAATTARLDDDAATTPAMDADADTLVHPVAPEMVIGVTGTDDRLADAENLLAVAKEACDTAHGMGIGSIYVAGSENRQQLQMEQMVAYVEKALEHERLLLTAQSVSSLTDTELPPAMHVAVAALDRASKPIPAQLFMPALGRSKSAGEVDLWAFKQTLSWMIDNEDEIEKYAVVIVPLSPASMKNEDLPHLIMTEFMETPVPPGKICFEIPDRSVVENVIEAGELIRTLKEFGCRFVLDEFGSGHDNYDYVKELDVDFVTVQTDFVTDAAKDPKDFAMAKSINELVHFMGKKTVAKQAPGMDLRETMREIGIDFLYDLSEQAQLRP